ncbi:hypothetical protein NDU88_000042, partial [Pleurodeles waltl]
DDFALQHCSSGSFQQQHFSGCASSEGDESSVCTKKQEGISLGVRESLPRIRRHLLQQPVAAWICSPSELRHRWSGVVLFVLSTSCLTWKTVSPCHSLQDSTPVHRDSCSYQGLFAP